MNACHTCSPGLIWITANFDFVGLNVELRKQWVVIQSGSRPVPPPQDKKIFELAANERLQFSRMNLYTVKVKNHCCLVALYFHSGVTVLVLYFVAAGFVSRVVWTESLQLSTLTNALWLLFVSLCLSLAHHSKQKYTEWYFTEFVILHWHMMTVVEVCKTLYIIRYNSIALQ